MIVASKPKPLNAAQREPLAMPARTRILVVQHGDNFVELFSDLDAGRIDVHVAQAPYTGTTAGELQAEEFLDKSLPARFAEIYLPGNRRKTFLVEPLAPTAMLARSEKREAFKSLDQIADRLRKRGLIQ